MPSPKKNKYAKAGRPTAYRPGYAKIIGQMCEDGATDQEVADFFRISLSTLFAWKHAQPELQETMLPAKAKADDRVTRSLYHRAVGYERDDVKIFMAAGEPVLVPYRQYFPPDVDAAFKWLKNRRPKEWRDVQQIEHGQAGDFDHLSDEQLVELMAKEAQLLLEDKSKKNGGGTDNSGT